MNVANSKSFPLVRLRCIARSYNKKAFDSLIAAKLAKAAGPSSDKALKAARNVVETKLKDYTSEAPLVDYSVKLRFAFEKVGDGKQYQIISGDIKLPHSLPVVKKERIVFLSLDKAQQDLARKNGATISGGLEKLPLIVDESISCDKLLCTKDIFPEIVKIAKILGPRGLMPSQGKGTVGANAEEMLTMSQYVVDFQSDPETASLTQHLGQMNWPHEHLLENTKVFTEKCIQLGLKLKGNAKKASGILESVHFQFSQPSKAAAKAPWFSVRVNPAEFFQEKPKRKLTFKELLQANNL